MEIKNGMVLSRGHFVQETDFFIQEHLVPGGQTMMSSWCGEETRRVTSPDNSGIKAPVKKEYI